MRPITLLLQLITVDEAMSTAQDYAVQDLISLARSSDVPIREEVLQELVRLCLSGKPAKAVYETIKSVAGTKTSAG